LRAALTNLPDRLEAFGMARALGIATQEHTTPLPG
jgi:hypothetical protein